LLNINKAQKGDSNVKIDHINISNDLLLEQAIKDANTVVYFTHDYFSLVSDKNKQLKQTAKICKAYNVDKLIAVNPIELANYYSNDELTNDPLREEAEAQEQAL
jgi:hypothetical protein